MNIKCMACKTTTSNAMTSSVVWLVMHLPGKQDNDITARHDNRCGSRLSFHLNFDLFVNGNALTAPSDIGLTDSVVEASCMDDKA